MSSATLERVVVGSRDLVAPEVSREATAHRSGPPVSISDIQAAARVLQGIVRPTPLVRAPPLPGVPEDAAIYLKLENLQTTGAFKLRGAAYRISKLTDREARAGVVAASAGNHSQGVAYAARARGVPATIVMARTASPLKVSATRALGARVVLHGSDYEEAHEEAMRLARSEGLAYVHPYDDPDVIAGQGTIGLEILEQLPDVRRVIVGVGGGGLLSGIGLAIRSQRRDAELVAVQPKGADTLRASLERGRVTVGGRPNTFADGLATRHVGDLTLRLLSELQVRAEVVDDLEIARAVFILLERAKVLAEGAGAAPLAALLSKPELSRDGPTVLLVSGGNLDPFLLDRILWIGLFAEGRLLRIRTGLSDLPGRLADFLAVAADLSANVRNIAHDRESPERVPGEVEVEVELEVRDRAHAEEVLRAYRERGWAVTEISPQKPA